MLIFSSVALHAALEKNSMLFVVKKENIYGRKD